MTLTINHGLGEEAPCSKVSEHCSYLTVVVLWRVLTVTSEFPSAVGKSTQ